MKSKKSGRLFPKIAVPNEQAPSPFGRKGIEAWDELPVAVRAFVDWPPEETPAKTKDIGPWPFYLFLDCETLTDQSQRLRVASYIWCQGGHEAEKGFFYDPATLRPGELRTLENYAARHGYDICTKDEFIDEILLGVAYGLGARIIGFNLPFDLSRLVAADPKRAQGRMKGGFSYKLRPQPWIPRIRTRHISRRLSFTEFTSVYRGRSTRAMRKRKQKPAPPRRGYFIDLKTLGGALFAGNFSLDSLAKAVGVTDGKLETKEHGRLLTAAYLKYSMRDVEVTAACFWRLKDRFEALGLQSITLESAFSEASIGKAHFRDMGIQPFLKVQPDFPKELLGIALSTFYGGRSEVHIRRVVSQIAYTDVLSMYPSVFVLMGLFRWVTAKGVDWCDATQETRQFLDTLSVERLLDQTTWPELTALVKVELDDDIFPIRAPYGDDPEESLDNNTIGLNRAKSDFGLWYTLADCAVSTILNGRPPRIVEALRFSPRELQDGLKPFCLLKNPAYRIDPAKEDFFKRVIEMRHATKAQENRAEEPLKSRLGIEQNFLKILANSTGYGIFAQFISESIKPKQLANCYGPSGVGFEVNTSKRERAGDFFHPLLATFITGAARLMLALAERFAIDAGLDWAFCDTDSMAFVKPHGMTDEEFWSRVQSIIDKFALLNPYRFEGSLLKLEDENFIEIDGKKRLHPLYVLPISAKRYVAFNIDSQNHPVIRKASTHGVGQYVSPYKREDAPKSIPAPAHKLKDVERWEHDLWYMIAKAALDGDLNRLDLKSLPGFNKPAASQYAATSYDRWQWFARYNATQPPEKRVRPGNFLLTYQMRPDDHTTPVRLTLVKPGTKVTRTRKPKPIRPVAPFHKDPAIAAKQAFDRETNEPVSDKDLLTYAELFADYPHHAESKFLNGGPVDSGKTERRLIYIRAENLIHIGKESNEYDEEPMEAGMDDTIANFGRFPAEQLPSDAVTAAIAEFGPTRLADQSGLSRQTVWEAEHKKSQPSARTKRRLQHAARQLKNDNTLDERAILDAARAAIAEKTITLRELARRIGEDPSNLAKIFGGKRGLPKRAALAIIRALKGK